MRLLSWGGTTEVGKPFAQQYLFSLLDSVASEKLPLTIWQACIHSSTAGEAKTVIKEFLMHEFPVVFHGNSLATQLCGNYGICASAEVSEELEPLVMWGDGVPFDSLVLQFQTTTSFKEALSSDVIMCSIPAWWCSLFASASKPLLAFVGLPILQYVPENERQSFLLNFIALVQDPRHVFLANNVYLAEEIAWQTGLRLPAVRILGFHTRATYMPSRSQVLVARPGTSGALAECVMNRFLDLAPQFPFTFTQFQDLFSNSAEDPAKVCCCARYE
mmetsp:Transcript_3389/g.6911  ORF Transcript_3389/g.6911 Transcript_3389/m.6911 type:complete len:274 (-) Transcript_3389:487-1308(-)